MSTIQGGIFTIIKPKNSEIEQMLKMSNNLDYNKSTKMKQEKLQTKLNSDTLYKK
jgi:hypothetical protein